MKEHHSEARVMHFKVDSIAKELGICFQGFPMPLAGDCSLGPLDFLLGFPGVPRRF